MNLQFIAPALAIGLVGLGASIGLGMIGKAWLESIGRNPESSKQSLLPGILALAFTEAIAIYGLIIALQLLGKI